MKKFLLYVLAVFTAFAAETSANAHCRPVLPQDSSDVARNAYSYGIDDARDSLAVSAIRHHMDSIRQFRPTVALVLSGGGAKGTSHIGVFRKLEEMHIPVDLVLGTSMGGLMGGMFSLGYSAEEVDSLVRTLDWGMELSDNVPEDYLSYHDRIYKRKYLISMPFFYSMSKEEKGGRNGAEDFIHQAEDLHLGAGRQVDAYGQVKDNLLSSLPSGFVYGQNVNNLFSSLTAGYQEDMPFWKLPIPFVCVATEMVTGKAKIWYSGKLNRALRSTMAIPGLFTPVNTDGMVLLDGGMRNNYPTDIARLLGADYVIGVDLSSGYKSYDELKNLTDILIQGSDMLGRESYENNVPLTDVTIKPDIPEYHMLSFDPVSVDSLIARGYRAAESQEEGLAAIKAAVGPDSLTYQNSPAYNLLTGKVRISEVVISGVSEEESRYLMRKIRIHAGQDMDAEDIDDAVATIYGTKAFDYVNYELIGREEPFRLVFDCKKGPIHHLGVGGRADTDETVALLLNLGFNVHSLRGSAFSFTGKVGSNPWARLQYYYKTPFGPTVNLAANFKYVDKNKFSLGEYLFNVEYYNSRAEAYLSNMRWAKLDVNYGVRGDFYKLGSLMASDASQGRFTDFKKNYYLSAFVTFKADTFDDGYFPSKGVSFALDYSCVFGGTPNKVTPFRILKADFRTVVGGSRTVSLLPFASTRFLSGSGKTPLPFVNVIGGRVAGRYMDQQIPFIGVTNAASCGDYLILAGTDLRFHIGKNNYVSAIVNAVDSASTLDGLTFSDSFSLGAGLEYAYNSIIGPVRADVHWSSISRKVGVYVSMGFDF